MVISASRRTDIPAFYSKWLMERLHAGYCCVANPFNANQVSRVSLKAEDVDVIVFWTKNARPMLTRLSELDDMDYRYYFQYTLNGYYKILEPNLPELQRNIETFKRVSEHVGADRIIWRYDPIILSTITPYSYHLNKINEIAQSLAGYTEQLVISIYDEYRAAKGRLRKLDIGYHEPDVNSYQFIDAMNDIVEIATRNRMKIFSCAEKYDLTPFGIQRGACIDSDYIRRIFGIDTDERKDKNQRPECGCINSKDIGFYDSCLNGCSYCYATRSLETAKKNRRAQHTTTSPSLLGNYECQPEDQQIQLF